MLSVSSVVNSSSSRRLRPPGLPAARVAACLGLLSDTHLPTRLATLPSALFTVFHGVDLLLHAGDVGELAVLDRLGAIAPVIAVHGNDDTDEAQRELPYRQLVTVAGTRLLLTHGHYPDRAEELAARRDDVWAPKLHRRAELGQRAGASIVVFGHTHIPMAVAWEGMLLLNPGALAAPNAMTRQVHQTVALLFIRDDGVPFPVHVDLAAPDRAYTSSIDLTAGFRAAHERFGASLLAPDLTNYFPRLREGIATLAPEHARLVWALWDRLAHRCWAGERAVISRADLLAALQASADLPSAVRARLRATLATE